MPQAVSRGWRKPVSIQLLKLQSMRSFTPSEKLKTLFRWAMISSVLVQLVAHAFPPHIQRVERVLQTRYKLLIVYLCFSLVHSHGRYRVHEGGQSTRPVKAHERIKCNAVKRHWSSVPAHTHLLIQLKVIINPCSAHLTIIFQSKSSLSVSQSFEFIIEDCYSFKRFKTASKCTLDSMKIVDE